MFDYYANDYSSLYLDHLLINQLLNSQTQLPKPTPIYNTSFTDFLPQQQSVIKSTNDFFEPQNCLPKCESPSIICQSSNSFSTTLISPTSTDTKSVKSRRLSYTREYKLLVINYYLTNGQNKYRTCKLFHITKSMLNGWLQKADKILNSREGAKKTGSSGRRPQFPNIEERLYEIYVEQMKDGNQVKLLKKNPFNFKLNF